MAVQIENITSEAFQRHIVLLDDQEVEITLRFLSVVQGWFISVTYGNRSVNGFRVSLNTLHMLSQNFPFDFIAEDLTGRGVDPFKIDDFSENRCALYMLQTADMEAIRGQDVEV